MLTTRVQTPRALVRLGLATIDVTPPIGIYHRLWGAASHERASGIHRPLRADVLAIGTSSGTEIDHLRLQLDHVGFVDSQHRGFIRQIQQATGVPEDRIVISCSHTHSGGWYVPDRIPLPGGELIEGYLKSLGEKLQMCVRQAIADVSPAVLEYSTARCGMAADRNCWDDERKIHVCGYNPGVPSPDVVTVARISRPGGALRGSIVHYACHPTTLGWESSVISPDFIGTLREVVEKQTGTTCVYFQGASGDLGPRDGFVGDPAVADRNGRAVGFAALSALELLGPPETTFEYAGPVVSGATLGAWKHVGLTEAERKSSSELRGGPISVNLPKRTDLDATQLAAEQSKQLAEAQTAEAAGDPIKARDCRAYAERAKRWIARLQDLPAGPTFALDCTVYRLGNSIWVTTGGEPFHWLQDELSRRFPQFTILVSPLSGNLQAAYLLRRADYGRGLYQEEPSLPAPGCLEKLCDALSEKILRLIVE